MRSEKEILKKLESIQKEYSWLNKCRHESGMGQKLGCMVRESRDKTIAKLKSQIEILEWILEKQ